MAGTTSALHPSPNAASLGKFNEMPVSPHTGIPGVTVPVWQIQRGDISVNVSLAYHGGGIKVDEAASWVGLGWALNAGGLITRSARGLPDNVDRYRAFEMPLLNRYLGLAGPAMSATERQNYVLNVSGGVTDAEPDLYSLSVENIACQFFLGKDGEFVTTSRALNLRIRHNALDAHGRRYTWLVTDGKGVQYKFSDAEHTTTTLYSVGKQGAGSTSTSGSSFDGDVSWGLNEIEDTKGNALHFTYARDASSFVNIATERVTTVSGGTSTLCAGKEDRGYTYADNQGSALRLTSIACGLEEVRFVAGATARLDLAHARDLQRVEVYYAGVPKRTFRIFSSYFDGNPIGTGGVYYPDAHNAYRLRLDSLREESADGALAKPAYRFAYTPGSLPYRGSAAQDHWGFYNGRDNRSRVGYPLGGQQMGANKAPNPAYAAVGTLAAIRYPTGGSIAFVYEANRYPRNAASTAPPIRGDSTFARVDVNAYPGVSNYGFPDEHTPAAQEFSVTPDMVRPAPGSPEDGKLVMQMKVNLTVDGSATSQPSGFTHYFLVYVAGTHQAIPFAVAPGKGAVAYLAPGRYTLQAYVEKEFNWPQDARAIHLDVTLLADITHTPFAAAQEHTGPGLRIKQIRKIFASGTEEIRTYDYADPATGKSSGKLGNMPDYQRDGRVTFINNPGGIDSRQYACDCHAYSSNSHYPLVSTRGSYIGYSHVAEFFDAGKTQGKKTYTYTNYDGFNDLNAQPAFPYPPASPQGWKRGLTLLERTYAGPGTGGGMAVRPVQADSLTYDAPIASLDWANGLKMGNPFNMGDLLSIDDVPPQSDEYSQIQVAAYRLETDSYQLQTKTTTQSAPTGTWQATTTYGYTPDTYQLNRVTNVGSDGATTVQRFFFPSDYRANAGSSPLLTGLLAANRLAVPVEQTVLSVRGATTRLVSGVAHEYGSVAGSGGQQRFYLRKIHGANTTAADPNLRYNFLALPAHYEEKSVVQKVTARGQPVVQRDRRAPPNAYQWGYEDRYPLAACTNATDTEFFYEGFEENTAAVSGAARTGNKCSQASYTIAWAPPNARTYVLSYWYRQAGAWKYRRIPYVGTNMALAGGDAYDDVGICPQDAQLTTYTYDPLVGVTSQTDPAGRTTTYEYDGLGRLVRTRDEQGRILSQQQYHYARP